MIGVMGEDVAAVKEFDWRSPELARLFLTGGFRWHQRFLSLGRASPGLSHTEGIFRQSTMAASLVGKKVIDIGSTNGFAAFLCERRGADVTATDIVDGQTFGFEPIKLALASRASFVQASVVDLLERFGPKSFDIALFWGVFYHLRHPLAALEIIAQLTREFVSIETVVFDSKEPQMLFCEGTSFSGDGSNWWIPTENLLLEMCADVGISVQNVSSTLDGKFGRILVEGTVLSDPPMLAHGYEPLVRSIRYDSRLPDRSA